MAYYHSGLVKAKRLADRRAERKPSEHEKRRRERIVRKKMEMGENTPREEKIMALIRDVFELHFQLTLQGASPLEMRLVNKMWDDANELMRKEQRRLGNPPVHGAIVQRILRQDAQKEDRDLWLRRREPEQRKQRDEYAKDLREERRQRKLHEGPVKCVGLNAFASGHWDRPRWDKHGEPLPWTLTGDRKLIAIKPKTMAAHA